jgi:Flp pilus assembly pilin Flp
MNTIRPTPRPTSLTCRARSRGATLVEYALVLSAVALPSIAGVGMAGAKLFRDYQATRDHVVRSTP